MNLFLYRLLLILFLPVIALASWNRCRKYRKTLRASRTEKKTSSLPEIEYCFRSRFGFNPTPFQKNGILIHAVSIGETRSIFPLLSELKNRHPDLPITITNSSIQGALHAFEFSPVQFQHQMLPYDYPFAVKRFLNQLQPKLVVMVETEIWPNLYQACQNRNIPVVLVNARMKEKSFKAYQKWGGSAIGNALKQTHLIAAQTEQDAEYFKQLGASEKQVKTLGNLKSDLKIDESLADKAGEWCAVNHTENRPIWVAASTHFFEGESEEKKILSAHKTLLKTLPDALLIIVPRHQSRFEEVAQTIQQSGLSWQKRSDEVRLNETTQVYLADSIGEMMQWYQVADTAFVGGSLVPFGGHNILEPAALNKPILSGEHYQNLSNMFTPFIEANAIRLVKDELELSTALASLLEDHESREMLANQAHQCYQNQTGALHKTLNELKTLLSET